MSANHVVDDFTVTAIDTPRIQYRCEVAFTMNGEWYVKDDNFDTSDDAHKAGKLALSAIKRLKGKFDFNNPQ